MPHTGRPLDRRLDIEPTLIVPRVCRKIRGRLILWEGNPLIAKSSSTLTVTHRDPEVPAKIDDSGLTNIDA
jgi:hypothetical protein